MSDQWLRRALALFAMVFLPLMFWVIASGWGADAEAQHIISRYSVAAGEVQAWMVDSATGRVWLCDDKSCRELPVANLHERVGR